MQRAFVFVVLFVVSVAVHAAAYTSAQTGPWHEAATWGGGGTPGDGDTATIANTHNVTLSQAVTVGTAGATDSMAVTIQSGGTLTHQATLTVKGDVDLQRGATWTQTGDLVFRPPTGSQYGIRAVTSGTGTMTWTATGVRISSDDTDGGSNGFIDMGFSASLGVSFAKSITWTDVEFVDMGTDGTPEAIDIRLENSETFAWLGGLAKTYGQIRLEVSGATAHRRIEGVSFRDALNSTAILYAGGNALTTGTNTLQIDMYEPATGVQIDYRCKDLDISGSVLANVTFAPATANPDTVYGSGVLFINSTNESFSLPSDSGSIITESAFIFNGGDNVHIYTEDGTDHAAGTNEIELSVFDGGGTGTGELGDLIPQRSLLLDRVIMLDRSAAITALGANTQISVNRGTFVGETWVNLGEGTGAATQLQLIVNSLFYENPRGVQQDGNFVAQTDAVIDFNAYFGQSTAGNLDHNGNGDNSYMGAETVAGWWSGQSAGVDNYSYAEDRGLNDISADPGFADDTRNYFTWDSSLGGAGNDLDAIIAAVVEKNGYDTNGDAATFDTDYSVSNYLTYIRAGFTPSNAALNGAGRAADGSPDIGAVDFTTEVPTTTINIDGSVNIVTSGQPTSFKAGIGYVGIAILTSESTDASDVFLAGQRVSISGALRVYDATEGLPDPVRYVRGVATTTTGLTCITTNAVDPDNLVYLAGRALTKDGRLYVRVN